MKLQGKAEWAPAQFCRDSASLPSGSHKSLSVASCSSTPHSVITSPYPL